VRRVEFTVIALLLLMVLATPIGLRMTLEEARMHIAEAYEAGGNVTGLMHRLKGALKLIAEAGSSGDLSLVDEVNALNESVVKDAPMVRDDGLRARNAMYIL